MTVTLRLLIAVISVVALLLQMALSLNVTRWGGGAWVEGLLVYFSFFTILTNILVAAACAIPSRVFTRPSVVTGIVVNIALVGIGYSLLLRHTWNPQGVQKVADVLLHDVVPVLFVIYWWLAVPRGSLRWSQIPFWLIYPGVYLLYALGRGALVGTYPYPFIDVTALGYGQVLINSAGIAAALVALAVIAALLKRAR